MLKASKTLAGLTSRKIAALLVAYSFLATSVWSLNPPGTTVHGGSPDRWMSLSALKGPMGDSLSKIGASHDPATSTTPVGPKILTNFAALNGARPWLDDTPPANCTIHSSQPSGDDGEDDDQRRDEHRSYQHHDYKYGSDDAPQGPNPPITPSGVAIFGQTYTRTTGPTDDFTSTIIVPAWASQPFFLHVVNGDAGGNHRVTSATVAINGTTLISESVFNQKVASIDCAVQLPASSTLQVDLDSKPGSFLTITALAKSLDHTPPVVTIVSPGAAVNTSQPHIDIRYQDLVGAGETVASGVNTTTLKVLLDGVDRTSLFTRFANEATADLPASLALTPGPHTITASIQDNAENLGQAAEQFQVNTAQPVIQILQPAAGSFLNSATPQVVLSYSGSIALNLASLKVTDQGVDITSSLTVGANGASGTAPTLPQGGNTIVVSISDQAGNQASASVTFNVDTTAPTITIVHPAQGSVHGTNSVDYLIQYSDDQAIDPSSLAVSLDGGPLVVAAGAASVSGTVTLNNGTGHVLTASIKDKAGNPATASSTFTVDTTVPNIHIISPANNSASNNPEPQFQVTYDESVSGVNTQSFKASVDGSDLTSLFNVGAGSASATLQSPLGDGSHTFSAQIASAAGNVAQTSSQVLIDTTKPQLTIVSPTGAVKTTKPAALAQYSDSGSGIDLNSVHVTLDNVDITATLGVSTSAASGNLGAGAGLSETTHQFAVSVADKAGNVAQASSSFLVDVTPPTAVFSSPADGSFINNPLPTIILTYSDPGSGSGVDLNSIHVFLAQGTAPETEITSLFTFGAGQGTAPTSASSPLVPGTYHLRAVLADKAGNPATPAANFVLDTTPPTYTIVAPAANAFLNTPTPSFTVNYQDNLSGVDTTRFALFVDGVDRTNRMTLTANGASGTLQAGDALADGTHQVAVNVFDLAGNQAPVVQQPFLVDTIPPSISITAPAPGGFTNSNRTPIAVTYSDGGSGIDVTTFQLLVDSVDHTADLTVTPTGATGSLSAALLDGSHSIVANIKDLAGNPATATTTYTVDTVPPQIVITQPADGSFTNATSIAVLGTVTSAAPVVSLTINGVNTPVSGNSFTSAPIQLGADGSSTTITAIATDAAGNSAHQTVTVTVDRTPPQVTFTQPVDGSFTNATSIIATGTVTGAAPVASVTVNGINASVSGNSFTSAPVQLGADGSSTTITAIATDTAGNTSAAKTVTVNVDRTAPQVVINQPVDGSFTHATSVTVSGTVTGTASVASVTVNGVNASLSGSSFTSAPIQLGADGSSTTITVIAKDSAGNSSSPKSVTVTVDRTPPQVTFTQPADGSFTSANSVVATGTVTSIAPVVSLIINGVSTPLSGNSFTSAAIPLGADGSSTAITASAIDAAGNVSAPKTVTVTVDRTQPTITLATPDTITPLHPGQITATVQDVVPVTQVVISVNNIALATLTSAPFQVTVAVPTGSNPGDTLTVTATVTDVAGNTASATPHSVRVGADGGVIVGQVLDDLTGLPLPSANVQIIAGTTPAIQTDSQGRYSLQASSSHVFLAVNVPPSPPATPGTTTVEREVLVQPGAGTVPVDARLTALPQGVAIGSSGGTLSAGTISVSVPSGTVPDGTSFQLTSLSGQGLPNLLPLGWSVVASFDLRSSASPASLNATVAQIPNAVANLVVYSPALHAWTMVTTSLQAVNGSLTFPVPGVGTYSLVVPDTTTPPIPVPAAGSPLTGIAMQALDPAVTGAISLNPPVLPAGGGTSTASVNLQGPTLSPSGTVVQANVSETFSLASGDKVSEETRSEDVVLYNALVTTTPAMVAQLPLTPSHKYTNAQLVRGNVHLDILSGREGVRGTPGGNDPVTVTDGIATLSVPGHALGVDTAIAVQSTSIESFVPTATTFSAIQEIVVDFSGEMLNTPAQLSIPSTGLNPADTFLLTQVVRINGVPHMVAVAVAQVSGQNLTSVASPGLPGVVQGGQYVFYDIASTSGTGFVTGVAKTGAGPVQALVKTDSLPIVSISGLVDGRYIVPALAGTVNLTANGTTTSLTGTASTPLAAGQVATVDIVLNGVVNTATVSPADKSLGVPVSTIITITSPVPIDPNSIVPANLVLFQGTPAAPGATVPLQTKPPFILSASGTVLTFAPAQNLTPATQYTIQVTGLADPGHGAIVVPASSFTTKANQPLTFDPNAITFAFPDANGSIHVSAPAGSLSAGTKVLIVDQSNAIVLSLTAFNDGSLSGDFPGTISDLLQVTVTDSNGATTTFTRSQFVAADGSVAVGAGGGTVTGPGGIAMIIPDGALDVGAVFKIEPLGQDAFPQLPNVPGTNFGGGMQITAPSMPFFKKEVKLAFPKPANAPDGAFYYVYRQITDQNNNVYFETIDHAFVQGTGSSAQIVTASPPFCGYRNPYGNFFQVAVNTFSPLGSAIVKTFFMWDFDPNQPGVASKGLIVGRVLQTVAPGPGQTEPTFHTVQGAVVQLADGSGNVAITDASCGEFTIFDPHIGGGPRQLTASSPDGKIVIQATANEVNGIQVDDATYDVTAGLESLYRNTGRVTITFPPVNVVPPPQIDIRLFTLNALDFRVSAPSIVQSGTPLVIAFKSALTVTAADINGHQLNIQGDYVDNILDFLSKLDFRATDSSSTDPLHNYIAGSPGAYTLTVSALTAQGDLVRVDKGFLVVAPGGSNNVVTPNTAPLVISATPPDNTTGVPETVFPQITFSEPVTNVAGNVALLDDTGQPARINLIGIKPDGTSVNPVGAADAITSLTIQPPEGLKFNTQYTLRLNGNIVDQNNPPLHLSPFTLLFTTFGPEELDQNQSPIGGLTRLVPIGQKAYGAKFIDSTLSGVDIFDISNPTSPIEEGITNNFVGRGIDTAGLKSSPVDRCLSEVLAGAPCPVHAAGGPLIAVATTETLFPMPSNIYLYDVSNPDHPARVGAVSATTSVVQDGSLTRIVMKDQFIFAATFNKGLQMIDVQQAVNDFQQVSAATTFGQDLTLDGTGFALDAVVNTIPVPINVPAGASGSVVAQATMMDLKVDNYAASAPGSLTFPEPPLAPPHTMIVATGRLPLVVADPQLGSGIQAILYPGPDTLGTGLNQAPLVSLDGQSQFQSGGALDVETLPVTDLLGNSTNKQIAVIVGRGTVSNNGVSSPGVPLLAVVDMTDARHPAIQGMIELIDNGQLIQPTDVVLSGNVALVATGTEVLLVDITNPADPFVSGAIEGNFGNHLAISDNGTLVSSDFNPKGVHTANLRPMISIPAVPPVLSKLANANQRQMQTLLKVTFNPRLVSAAPKSGTQGTAQLMDGSTSIGPAQPVQWAQSGKTFVGQVTFAKGLNVSLASAQDASKVLSLTVTTETDQGTLTETVPVTFGRIDAVADLNNDTVIDDKDIALKPVQDADPQNQGNPDMFAFWEASNIAHMQGNIRSLVDFATVRLRIGAWPSPDQAKIHLHMTGAAAGDWVLANKHGFKFKDYLADSNTANSQLQDITALQANCQAQSPASGGSAVATPILTQGSCVSDVNGEIEMPASFQPGDLDFVFACNKCPQVTGSTPRVLEVEAKFADGTSEVLDHINLDIRPVEGWIGLYTARQAPGQQGYGTDPDTPFFAARPHQDVFPNGNQYQTVPNGANVTVFVHGYNVSDQDAVDYWVPMMMKRLYWAGHPVLGAQTDSQGHPAFFAGFEWPGDINPALDLAVTAFPIDEFRALQSGVPLAKWLNSLKTVSQANTVSVIAHSLGNLVTNSALSRNTNNPTEIAAGTVDTYIMNEAAFPVEAFGATSEYPSNVTHLTFAPTLRVPHLTQVGAPADTRWISEWSSKSVSDQNNWNCTALSLDYGYVPTNPAVCPATNSIVALPSVPPLYFVRWNQRRPGSEGQPQNGQVPPDTDPIANAPRRGNWSNFFTGNLPGQGAVQKVYNTFNTGDNVLGVWPLAQLSRKPFRSATVAASDLDFAHPILIPNPSVPFPIDRTHEGGQCEAFDTCWPAVQFHFQEAIVSDPLFWAQLPLTDPDQAKLFQDRLHDHWNITRQWAELAFWFPSQTGPVGIASQPSVPFSGEYDFTIPGQAGILDDIGSEFSKTTPTTGADSHSFAQIKPLPDVWCVFKTWRQLLDPNNPDPDPVDPTITQRCVKIR